MATILVPYHQDEQLPESSFPLPHDRKLTPGLEGDDRFARLRSLYRAVADEIAGQVRAGETPTIVSGDCLIASGVVAGVQRAGIDPVVIWLDAHGDVHTPETSTSGYLGGMALRFLLDGELGTNPMPQRDATLVDARDLDPAEEDFLATAEIRRGTVTGVPLPEGPVVLHVDVDVIDPSEVPGLLFPAPGGPSTSTVADAVRRVRSTGHVVALHIACPWEPGVGNEIRARLLAEIAG
ncbi:arginase family protein [Amycolatopsis sp. K13G38]|uniref:Arginase family protein n=1 Tax=Amycolatopsis acididurans TaxID=2724524 RepID=A0ABX1J5X5_9PSEU|nr:arginase family protein [Amycolatopsis acididurans]NKQ55153.1 arginase family protein [Amycolatopsis acididurans]